MRTLLKLLAPYVAVGIFWCVLSNGWLAILAYHAQILLWRRGSPPAVRWRGGGRGLLLVLPAVLTGPLLHGLLPHIASAELSTWLESHQLTRLSLAIMVPYFGIVHPILEQLHWAPLRERTPASHFMFAGYHVLVLHSLLPLPWLAVCFAVLSGASMAWHETARRSGSLAAPVASHVSADLGVIIVAWRRA